MHKRSTRKITVPHCKMCLAALGASQGQPFANSAGERCHRCWCANGIAKCIESAPDYPRNASDTVNILLNNYLTIIITFRLSFRPRPFEAIKEPWSRPRPMVIVNDPSFKVLMHWSIECIFWVSELKYFSNTCFDLNIESYLVTDIEV